VALLLTIITIVIVLGDTFISNPSLKQWAGDLKLWSVIMIAPSMFLAMIQLVRWESGRIRKKEKEWPLSIITLVAMVVTFFFGILPPLTAHPYLQWLVLNIQVPLDGLGWFFVALVFAGGFWRSLRVKSIEMFALVFSCIIMFMTQVPVLAQVNPAFGTLGNWILTYPAVGATRGFGFVAGGAVIAFFLRTITGKEKGYFR
jgi:hypothetical protein